MEKSIDFFHKKGIYIEEARSRISIVLELSYQGKIDEGIAHLITAEKILKGSYVERHSLLNNIAALNIYSGKFGSDITLNHLLNARATVTNEFELFIISMNLMIVLTLTHRITEAKHEINFLVERLRQYRPKEKEIRRIAFYNISVFYRSISLFKKSTEYLRKAKEVFPDFDMEAWNKKFDIENYTDTNYKVKMKYFFQPTFIYFGPTSFNFPSKIFFWKKIYLPLSLSLVNQVDNMLLIQLPPLCF